MPVCDTPVLCRDCVPLTADSCRDLAAPVPADWLMPVCDTSLSCCNCVPLTDSCRDLAAPVPADWLLPLRPPDEESSSRVLGVLLCLRDITPLLEELCDGVSLERLLQVCIRRLRLLQAYQTRRRGGDGYKAVGSHGAIVLQRMTDRLGEGGW